MENFALKSLQEGNMKLQNSFQNGSSTVEQKAWGVGWKEKNIKPTAKVQL